MANGTRNDTIVNQKTDLYFQFMKNGTKYSPYNVSKVEIYGSYNDAQASTNMIQLIDGTGEIEEVSLGKFYYVANELPTSKTYFDKIYIQPEVTSSTISFVNPFYVRQENYGGSVPGSKEKVPIHLYVYDVTDKPLAKNKAVVFINEQIAKHGNDIIKKEDEVFMSDADGHIVMDLLETDTLTEDTGSEIFYTLVLNDKYNVRFTVPKGTFECNFSQLPKL